MKIFRTGSAEVVKNCRFNFSFLPIWSHINTRTARFLQKFIVENSLCLLFAANATRQLSGLE